MSSNRPRVSILYCTQCNWLLRSAWMAQELLQTFSDALGEVALIPGTGGIFEIRVDDTLVWERKRDGGFPGPKDLKQRVRDLIAPERDLGHTDRPRAELPADKRADRAVRTARQVSALPLFTCPPHA